MLGSLPLRQDYSYRERRPGRGRLGWLASARPSAIIKEQFEVDCRSTMGVRVLNGLTSRTRSALHPG